jgi:hypothetical protein
MRARATGTQVVYFSRLRAARMVYNSPLDDSLMRGGVRHPSIKNVENNPMHSSRREWKQWVTPFPNSIDSSGKTAAQCHHSPRALRTGTQAEHPPRLRALPGHAYAPDTACWRLPLSPKRLRTVQPSFSRVARSYPCRAARTTILPQADSRSTSSAVGSEPDSLPTSLPIQLLAAHSPKEGELLPSTLIKF